MSALDLTYTLCSLGSYSIGYLTVLSREGAAERIRWRVWLELHERRAEDHSCASGSTGLSTATGCPRSSMTNSALSMRTRASSEAKLLAASATEIWTTFFGVTRRYCISDRFPCGARRGGPARPSGHLRSCR